MLNGLAVLMFGKKCPEEAIDKDNIVNNCDDDVCRDVRATDETEDNFNVEDDDWILINKQENAEFSSSTSDVMSKSGGDFECSDFELMTMPSTRASSCSSVARIADWNLLPPPCFDRSNSNYAATQRRKSLSATPLGDEQPSTGDMEISIFENLLIEHPSLSVYCRLPLTANAAVAAQRNMAATEETKENADDAATLTVVARRPQSGGKVGAARLTTLADQQKFCCNNKLVSISSTAEQQHYEIVQKTARALSANRLRRNNLLVRRNCASTKRFANLQ